MSWANCGTDSNGRPIGYAYDATCDHPECENEIDRGLAYACGGMHGQNCDDCEGYFCQEHLGWPNVTDEVWLELESRNHGMAFCPSCRNVIEQEQ